MHINPLGHATRYVGISTIMCVWLGACGHTDALESVASFQAIPDDHVVVQSQPPSSAKVLQNQTLSLTKLNTPRLPDPTQIRYLVDPGPLGPLTNTQATLLVQTLLPRWEAVANVSFQFDGQVAEDITAENFSTYAPENEDEQCPWLQEIPVATDPIIVIFDHDGHILDSLGRSASRGVCLQCIQQFNVTQWLITKNLIILDGTDLTASSDEPQLLQQQLPAVATTILHEFGHALGLGHAAIAIGGANAPIMAPTLSMIGGTPPIQRPDDIAWLDYLYPKNIATPIGGLAGTLHFDHGSPNATYYASVTAINAADAHCELFQNWAELQCQANGRCSGDFLIPRLPAGDYAVLVDRLQTDGQLASVSWELWNGSDIASESPSSFAIVPVASTLVTDIDLTLPAPAAGSVPVITIPGVQTYDGVLSGTLHSGSNGRCPPDGSDLAATLGIVIPSAPTPAESEEPETKDAAGDSSASETDSGVAPEGAENVGGFPESQASSNEALENEASADESSVDAEASGVAPPETRVDSELDSRVSPAAGGSCGLIPRRDDR